ncbi:hypothetical protein ABPG74_004453 [Tetrahymena malaccensis]
MDSQQIDQEINIQQQQFLSQNYYDQINIFLRQNNIEIEKKIGEGYFAEVFQAIQINEQRRVAIKKVKDQTKEKKFEDEKNAMFKIKNQQYAIQIIGGLVNKELGYNAIIMEICDCTLTEIFEKNIASFSFEQLIALSYQLLKGLLVFQEKGIIHGDLKPENILYNQLKNRFLISDLGLSQILQKPELQQFISKQSKSKSGNLKYMAPEVVHDIKPYTIKIDVFSIGLIFLEFVLKRELTLSESLRLKDNNNLFDVLPDLVNNPNIEFINQILAKMVCYESNQRLESMQLLQRLDKFIVNEESLKSIQFQNKNIQQYDWGTEYEMQFNTIAETKQLTNYSKEINIENNISQTNKNSFKDINLSDIQLLHKEQLKIVCINKNNLNDNQDLSGYQVAKLDFRGTLNVQNNCLCFGMGSNNVVSAIQKIQDVKNITSVILDLTNNVINIKKVQSIFASLVKCKNINSLEISINQDYYNQGDMKNILCFLQLCQEMPNFNLRLSGQENEVILKKQGNMINILLDHTQFKFDELLHKERFTNIKAALNNMPIQTQIKIKIDQKFGNKEANSVAQSLANYQNITDLALNFKNSKIDIEGAKQIASIIDNSKNTKYLSLHLSQEQISLRFFIFFNLNALSMYVQFRMITLVLNLKVLIYQYSNDFHMGYQGANYIIEKVQNCQHLNQLSLRLNKTRIEIEGTNVIKNSSIQNGSNSIKFNINLSNNINMDDQGANSIFESIIKCQRLNQFSVKIKQNLLKIKIIILTLIFQSDCQIGAQGIKGVTNILQKYNTINLLNAFLSNSKIDVEGINFDKNYIQSGSDKIKFNISLSNSIKMDEQSINDVIQAIQNNSNLYQLRLKSVDSNVGNIGVNSISSLIKKYGNVTQLSACLSNSKVSVEGTNIMVNNIQNNQKSIQFNIDLCIDFHIGTQRANSIMEAIKNCQKLTKMSLKLIDCNIGIQGVNGISSIIKKYENVTQIGFCLSKTRIHIEGSNIVNDNINNDASIKFNVDLSDNSIGAQGFKSITDTILNCKSVKKLDVHLFGDYYLIGVEGIRTLTKEKQNCENITELSLKLINCNFGLDGANLIADVINNYSSVTQFSLSLSENNIGIDEVQIIANAIKNFKSITELDLKLKQFFISLNQISIQENQIVLLNENNNQKEQICCLSSGISS